MAEPPYQKESTMSDRAYRDLYYDEPHVQAEFERLVQRVRDADRAREPLGSKHRQAERAMETGAMSEAEYRSAEDAYIAAGNAIAAAQRAVDAFLQQNRNYRVR
jgi:hypothetical protein